MERQRYGIMRAMRERCACPLPGGGDVDERYGVVNQPSLFERSVAGGDNYSVVEWTDDSVSSGEHHSDVT
jgi:hypothetical protein